MRKKILIFGHNDATQFLDIYNQYTKVFDRKKYEITVAILTGQPSKLTESRLIADKVHFLTVSKQDTRYLKFKAIKQLLALCRQNNYQLVICHRYKPTYIMLWVMRFLRIPSAIFVMHELKTMSAWGRKALISMLHNKNMLFAGVSNAVRDDMRKDLWIHADKIQTLYNMIDVEETQANFLSREQARKILGLEKDDIVFGNIARLSPNKNHHALIQAFAVLKANCPKAKLVISGDGILENTLKTQANQLGLQQAVHFTGFLPQAFRYLQAFDCFILPSIQEAFGRVLLEAMLAKLPIISTKVNGIPEVLGNTGTLIAPHNVEALAEAMKSHYLLSVEEKINQGLVCYQRAINHFSIPVFHKQFWQLPLIQTLKD